MFPITIDFPRIPAVILALLLTLPTIMLAVAAFKLFRKTGQEPDPWQPTPEIITDGVYRYTRNPMYLGMTMMQAAIGIGFMNVWILLLIPLSCTIIYFAVIRFEEAYLERKFGDVYLKYKASVRRWL